MFGTIASHEYEAFRSDPTIQRIGRTRLAAWLFFVGFAGQAVRNTLGWWGFGVLALLLIVAGITALVRLRPTELRGARLPKPLIALVALAGLSAVWSAYPLETLLGTAALLATTAAATFMALCMTWFEILWSLGRALRWILGLSLVFELAAALLFGPIFPAFTDYPADAPDSFYWSQALLFEGGPIQGIVGNRNLLAFAALVALIVFGVQWLQGIVTRGAAMGWMAVALLTHAVTRSATLLLATGAVLVVLVVVLLLRNLPVSARAVIYPVGIVTVAVLGIAAVASSTFVLRALDRDPTLTGRMQIWQSVVELAQQRPLLGWGWISYWAPWVEPFDGLAVRNGTEYLQAHNAWLDVWLQLGVVGLAVFVLLALAAIVRAWWMAVDIPPSLEHLRLHRQPISLLPILLLAALLLQSLSESRLLIEGNWLLFALVCVKVKVDPLPFGTPYRHEVAESTRRWR